MITRTEIEQYISKSTDIKLFETLLWIVAELMHRHIERVARSGRSLDVYDNGDKERGALSHDSRGVVCPRFTCG